MGGLAREQNTLACSLVIVSRAPKLAGIGSKTLRSSINLILLVTEMKRFAYHHTHCRHRSGAHNLLHLDFRAEGFKVKCRQILVR